MLKKIGLGLVSTILAYTIVSCTGLEYTPVPTSYPVDYVPTMIALTVQAGQSPDNTPSQVVSLEGTPTTTPIPVSTLSLAPATEMTTPLAFSGSATNSPPPSSTSTTNLSPSPTPVRRATRTPTITPTPTTPVGDVQISEPGPMSRVSSPVHVVANLRSIASGTYRVEVWAEALRPGEEARLLYREVQRLISNPVPWVFIDQDIQFELSRVSEYGQLRMSVYDQYDRPVSISSVDLILLAMGPSEITPSGSLDQSIIIREPGKNQLIQGGMVIVSGMARPSEDFMLVQLVAADGSIVGYRQVFVTPAADGSYAPFSVEVPYTVSSPTWVRLEISESGLRIPGVENLSSVEVYLSP